MRLFFHSFMLLSRHRCTFFSFSAYCMFYCIKITQKLISRNHLMLNIIWTFLTHKKREAYANYRRFFSSFCWEIFMELDKKRYFVIFSEIALIVFLFRFFLCTCNWFWKVFALLFFYSSKMFAKLHLNVYFVEMMVTCFDIFR